MPPTKKTKASAKKTLASSDRRIAAAKERKPAQSERTADDLAAQLVPPILVLAALFLVICFISADSTGIFGNWLSNILYGLFSTAAYTIPAFIVIIAAYWKHDYVAYYLRRKLLFASICLVCVAALSQTGGPDTFNIKELWTVGLLHEGGGVIGGLIGQALLKSIGRVGMMLVSISLLTIFGLFLFGLTPQAVRIWIAFKLHEHNERLRAGRAEVQSRRVYLNKPNLEDETGLIPLSKKRRKMSATDDPAQIKQAYIYEGEDGGGGKIKLVDYEGVQITTDDSAPDNAIDPAAFDAALGIGENVQTASENRPALDMSANAGNPSAQSIPASAIERIKAIGLGKPIKKRTDLPETEGMIPKSDAAKASIHEIFEDIDKDGLDLIRKFNENQRSGMGYASSDGSYPGAALYNESEADVTLNISRGDAVPGHSPQSNDASNRGSKPYKYEFPPVSLLQIENTPQNTDVSEELHSNAVKLVETLRSFKVRTKIVNVSRGPTITRYELSPEEGIRVRSIANLVDDIALNLATTGVRIEAPIPGKSAVGIEVPNRSVSIVYVRELIENHKFTQAQSKLTLSLGMDVAGEPVYLDISKMPHLLIAGATGMGKSVCINSLLISLLYKATPDEVKLILVDPKKVELNIYNGLPHLLVPVVSDPKKAAGSLHWAVTEMERRFDMIEAVGARNIKGYNTATKDDPEKEFMPYIVIVIDELADLMMTAPADVEESICRLAQKARAAGMHLIIGTQRPSVDVITGLIKANIPSRIAFTVSSQTDSRVVIDIGGAEKLIGRGDMLYAPVGSIKPIRVQGAFVSEQEVESVVEFIKKQSGETSYDTDVIETIEREAERCVTTKRSGSFASADGNAGENDSMLKPAIELALENGKIATSLIQRKLSLGYGRAAKIIDRMEEMGIVSPPEGKNPRTVLITRQQYMEMVLNRDGEL